MEILNIRATLMLELPDGLNWNENPLKRVKSIPKKIPQNKVLQKLRHSVVQSQPS